MNNTYQMPNSYSSYYTPNSYYQTSSINDERLVGGFAFPFLLGGVTGAALAPNFWRPNYGRPIYPYPPRPYPYPYPYPPRRWF